MSKTRELCRRDCWSHHVAIFTNFSYRIAVDDISSIECRHNARLWFVPNIDRSWREVRNTLAVRIQSAFCDLESLDNAVIEALIYFGSD